LYNGYELVNDYKNKFKKGDIIIKTKDKVVNNNPTKCIVCGEILLSKKKNAEYCSNACRKIEKNNIPLNYLRICKECGKKFINKKSNVKYCSKQCRYLSTYNSKHNINLLTFICLNCGKEFKNSSPKSKYCSKTCRDKYYKKLKGDIIYTCKNCDKEFNKNDGFNKSFCSEECNFNFCAHTLICKYCGNEFKSLNIHNFCSNICRKEHYRTLRRISNGKDKKRSIRDSNFIPEGERKFYDLLTYIFYDCELIYRERYYWLTNPETGYPLELDIYIPNLRLAFEYDGSQHKKFTPYIHKTMENFISMQRRDIFKNNKCKELGITLIRYDDIINKIDTTTLKYKLLDGKRPDITDKYFVGL